MLVLHDWGSALGLDWARRHERLVKGLVLTEFITRYETWLDFPERGRELFKSIRTPKIGRELIIDRNEFVERILPASIVRTLTEAEMRWHFQHEAAEKIPYAIARYKNESRRLLNVVNIQLSERQFLAGEYSIADIATFPWMAGAQRDPDLLETFPNLKRWLDEVSSRPTVQRRLP